MIAATDKPTREISRSAQPSTPNRVGKSFVADAAAISRVTSRGKPNSPGTLARLITAMAIPYWP